MKPKSYDNLSKSELIERLKQLESLRAFTSAEHAKQLSTQQELADVAVADREERLRAILDTAVEGIITIDERGIIESANLAAERIFGYKAREIIGKNVSLLMPSPHREMHDGYINNYLRTGRAKIIGIGREVTGRRKDGTVFPMDLSVSEVRLAKRRVFTGFIRDITERKRLEKEILEISDREQRRIGQDLHDGLCQQLAGIELMSQVLAQKLSAVPGPHSDRVSEIADHVRDAISHTRSLARGLSPVTLESEGLMSALQELATNTEKIFNVTCDFDFSKPIEVGDHAAATHLFRIAQEAVSNAIKHGRATEITIFLRDPGQRLVLRISDNGAGFPKTMSKNKGMGLRIMQSRAGMIGGTIAVERNPGGGVSIICAVPHKPSMARSQKTNARKK